MVSCDRTFLLSQPKYERDIITTRRRRPTNDLDRSCLFGQRLPDSGLGRRRTPVNGRRGLEAMDIFAFRQSLVADYAGYTRGFVHVREPRLRDFVDRQLDEGVLWPEPLIQ